MNDEGVLIVGGGAIGATLAAGMLQRGWSPTVVRRAGSCCGPPRAAHAGTWPRRVELPQSLWRESFPAARPERLTLFVAAKAYHLKALAAPLASFLRPQDLVVLVQNGIGVDEELGDEIPRQQLARAILGFGAVIDDQEARLTFTGPTSQLGPLDSAGRPEAARAARVLCEAGFQTELSDDISREAWRKAVLSSMALVCVRYDLTIGAALESPSCMALYESLARERLLVAQAAGYSFDDSLLERCREDNRAAAAHLPSMVIDHRRARPLELEHDVLRVIACARDHGLSVPANEEIASCLQRSMQRRGAAA